MSPSDWALSLFCVFLAGVIWLSVRIAKGADMFVDVVCSLIEIKTKEAMRKHEIDQAD